MVVPVWMIFASSTHTSSMINMNGLQMFLGDSFYENYLRVLLYQGGFFKEITALKMFFNSFIMATGVAILSVVTSLTIIFLIGTPLINYFARKQITGPIRQDGPIDHIIKKSGTPTMGGFCLLYTSPSPRD